MINQVEGIKMKLQLLAVIAIVLLSVTADAADDCETKYKAYLQDVKSLTQLTDADKAQFVKQLEKALKLCKEGKNEEAKKIVDDLKGKAAVKDVFSTHDSP